VLHPLGPEPLCQVLEGLLGGVGLLLGEKEHCGEPMGCHLPPQLPLQHLLKHSAWGMGKFSSTAQLRSSSWANC
jgi:hypothetical protein